VAEGRNDIDTAEMMVVEIITGGLRQLADKSA
jgi:hypothetical protein